MSNLTANLTVNPPNMQTTPANPEPNYAYSTGNAFRAFAKFDSKNFFVWRRNMEIQLRALGQWEVIDGMLSAPTPAVPNQPTTDETWEMNIWNLHAA